ncbi:MAG: 2-phosphosulfolactate phosphatase [Synergistaceae bacterium]|nr:2-phosphosulfolactate phosphatase [Synergistaceae bacterium]
MGNFEADLIFSCGENIFLPVVDSWIVIDVLRATTVITRWFELDGPELFPVKGTNEARQLVTKLKELGRKPLLMGEVNGIPPEGFDLGNSPVELNKELIKNYDCGVMSTTNGTVALNQALESGSYVVAASFRNASACLAHALSVGPRVGLLCSGRKRRPSWEDTLLAGAILEELNSLGQVLMTDSAKIALALWKNRDENLEACVKKSEHAEYLLRIGYENDIKFACEKNISSVVPVYGIVRTDGWSDYPSASLKAVRLSGPHVKISQAPEPQKNPGLESPVDPFEELLAYTKKNSPDFFLGRKN